MEVILASASPRRLALLRQVGVEPIVKVSHIEEVSSAATPQELVKENALLKGRAVCRTSSRGDLVVAADTVVALDGTVLGKPASPEEAMEMIRQWLPIRKGLNHRTDHPESSSYQAFLLQLCQRLEAFSRQFPTVGIDAELAQVHHLMHLSETNI